MKSRISVFALAVGMALPSAIMASEPDTTAPSDGTVYAGISPDTNKPIYTTPKDAPGIYSLEQAGSYCADLRAGDHDDWRMPTKGELNVLYNNRAAIAGFDESGSDPGGWYWSSSPIQPPYIGAWDQRFSDGRQSRAIDYAGNALRCVRD